MKIPVAWFIVGITEFSLTITNGKKTTHNKLDKTRFPGTQKQMDVYTCTET